MGLLYENLDNDTRNLMLGEIDLDTNNENIYISNYLNTQGQLSFPGDLREAALSGTDDTFADSLRDGGCFKTHVERKKPKGGTTLVAVPVTAAQTLAEAQFNLYYMRALAIRAQQDGKSLVVYRAKAVENPRETSERMLGTVLNASHVLEVLRATKGVDPAIDIPLPNSGLTVKLR